MTRTVAREIAIQLSFAAQLAGDDARETADTFFSREYFATLAEEDPLFQEYPDEKQLDYIRRLTGLVYDHMYELNHMIEKYARGWRLERISRCLLYTSGMGKPIVNVHVSGVAFDK